MKIHITILFLLLVEVCIAQTEGVSISPTTAPPHESAMLDVQSTTKGILIPTMTMHESDAIINRRHGLMVFVDDSTNSDDGYYYWDSNISGWVHLGGASLWAQVGNTIENTNAGPVMISGDDHKNEIIFKGTIGDTDPQFGIHTAIVERVYVPGTELSELLLFKGNDNGGSTGPDRIRMCSSGETIFQISNSTMGYDSNSGVNGTTVMSILNNKSVTIGDDILPYKKIEFPEFDASYAGKKNGTIILRANSSWDDGNTNKKRVLIVGADGNEINAQNEQGTKNVGAMLFLNYENGHDVRIGGYTAATVSNLQVQGCVSATNISCSSDRRLKKNIQPVNNVLPILSRLKPVTFNWNYETGNEKQKHYGLIAQEVEQILPSIVSEDQVNRSKAPRAIAYKNVTYTEIIPLLIKGINELDQKLEKVQASGQSTEVSQLKKELSAAQNTIQTQQKQLESLTLRITELEKLMNK